MLFVKYLNITREETLRQISALSLTSPEARTMKGWEEDDKEEKKYMHWQMSRDRSVSIAFYSLNTCQADICLISNQSVMYTRTDTIQGSTLTAETTQTQWDESLLWFKQPHIHAFFLVKCKSFIGSGAVWPDYPKESGQVFTWETKQFHPGDQKVNLQKKYTYQASTILSNYWRYTGEVRLPQESIALNNIHHWFQSDYCHT